MTEFGLTQLLAWIVGVNTIITFLTTIYNLASTRATKALKAIDGLSERIDKLAGDRQRASDAIGDRFQHVEGRLLKIEGDMEHLPDREQFQKIALSIEQLSGRIAVIDERLSGRIETLNERLQPVQAMANRLQELEMERARPK